MKKTIAALFLVSLLAFCLCSCGKEDLSEGESAGQEKNESSINVNILGADFNDDNVVELTSTQVGLAPGRTEYKYSKEELHRFLELLSETEGSPVSKEDEEKYYTTGASRYFHLKKSDGTVLTLDVMPEFGVYTASILKDGEGQKESNSENYFLIEKPSAELNASWLDFKSNCGEKIS